ncbi:prepilin-type N-terminal cleavage/methylation domain-containing protein [Opitutaceae bacterium TAV1]|nr:prepilin-type N-terminal cleavage/methylation domain-containing protein [Opitutaceae bacterium TAV1]
MNTCPPYRIRKHHRSAFTLIELLTVIAIIGILAAIIIPTVGKVRDTARSAQCLGNLRQIGAAARLYIEDNKGMTPPLSWEFYPELWPYAYNPAQKDDVRTAISSAGTSRPGAPLTGTIFECPKVNNDKSPEVTTIRSYGVNDQLAPGAANKSTKGININLITTPSLAAFFGDVKNSSALRPAPGRYYNGRHNDKMNVVFVDGHAAAVTLTTEITDPGSWNTNPFWIGIQR